MGTLTGILTGTDEPKAVVRIAYDYGDRRNGWYAQRLDEDGNQVGAAEYRYRKVDVIRVALAWGEEYGVPVRML